MQRETVIDSDAADSGPYGVPLLFGPDSLALAPMMFPLPPLLALLLLPFSLAVSLPRLPLPLLPASQLALSVLPLSL